MNYYKHHIGDYDAATSHLTWLEDAAYRRLLCLYYRKEQPIPLDVAAACRLVRATTKQERDAVESVLREFFCQGDDGWTHARCDGEIEAAALKASANRSNGKNGGRPRKVGLPKETQPKPTGFLIGSDVEPTNNLSHTPLAISQEKAKATSFAPQASPKDGTRIPEGFKPDVDWALAKYPLVDAATEADKFCDYWSSKAGKDARKTDWPKVWQNWVRKAAEDVANRRLANRGSVGSDDWRKVAV